MKKRFWRLTIKGNKPPESRQKHARGVSVFISSFQNILTHIDETLTNKNVLYNAASNYRLPE